MVCSLCLCLQVVHWLPDHWTLNMSLVVDFLEPLDFFQSLPNTGYNWNLSARSIYCKFWIHLDLKPGVQLPSVRRVCRNKSWHAFSASQLTSTLNLVLTLLRSKHTVLCMASFSFSRWCSWSVAVHVQMFSSLFSFWDRHVVAMHNSDNQAHILLHNCRVQASSEGPLSSWMIWLIFCL